MDNPDLALDESLSTALYNQAGIALPFSSLHSSKDEDPAYGVYTEPDSLLWFGQVAKGLHANPELLALPKDQAQQGVLLYGQFCAFFATLPSAYYCAARFPESFEDAILCSINGGGQNTMRSSLVAALLGARVGLQGIPPRFIEGLDDHKYLLGLASSVADSAMARTNVSDSWTWPEQGDHLNGLPDGRLSHHNHDRPTKPSDSLDLFLVSTSAKTPSAIAGGPASNIAPLAMSFALGIVFTVAFVAIDRRIRQRTSATYRYEQVA